MKRNGMFFYLTFLAVFLSFSISAVASEMQNQVVAGEFIEINNAEKEVSNFNVSTNISEERAISIAKDLFKNLYQKDLDISFGFMAQLVDGNMNYELQSKYGWELTWQKYNNNSSEVFNILINADNGRVIRFDYNSFDHNNNPIIAKILKDEAKQISDDFVKKFRSDIAGQLILKDYAEDIPSTRYGFSYNRVVNGIEYINNSIYIVVDGITGKIVSFYEIWNKNETFEPIKDVISKEEINKIFYDNVQMELQYIPINDSKTYRPIGARLVYNPIYPDNSSIIDAKTGKFESFDGPSIKIKELTSGEIAALKKGNLTKKNTGNILSEEEIREIALEIIENLDIKVTIQSVYYNNNPNDYYGNEHLYYIDMIEENLNTNYSMELNGFTGELIRYNKYVYDSYGIFGDNTKNWEECYNVAVNALAKFFPNEMYSVDTKQIDYGYPSYEYYYTFTRKINGIPFYIDSISITVNANDGRVTGLNKFWSNNLTFSNPRNVISKDESKDVYFKYNEPNLVYYNSYMGMGPENNSKPKLSYMLAPVDKNNVSYFYIDALTGKLLNHMGEAMGESSGQNPNIIGHWAEKQIRIFDGYQYIDSKKINVDDKIAYKNLIKLLVDVKGNQYYDESMLGKLLFTNISEEDEMYKYLQHAIVYNVLDNEARDINLNKTVIREELAKILIKYLGFEKIASMTEIYNLEKIYSDSNKIDKELTGYVALSRGLEILVGNNKMFMPKKEVTWAEAIVAIVNAL